MPSAELHRTAEPKEDSMSSNAEILHEGAPKALTVQSDMNEVTSDLLQHTNGSRSEGTTTESQIISSDLEETSLSKSSQESICNINVSEYKEISAVLAEEKETDNLITAEEEEGTEDNKYQGLYISSKSKETGNQDSNLMKPDKTERDLFKDEIKFLQCPFTWNLNSEKTAEKIIASCNDKLNMPEEEEEEYKWWPIFILTLVLCHQHSLTSSSEAMTKLQECENLINKCQSNDKPNTFFQNIKEALLHVVNASRCHLLVLLNMFDEAMKLKQGISRYEDMNKQNMAAIFGIRSAMLMEYGYEGTRAALEYAEKAVNLDGNESEWNFLYGKLLGRIRRVEKYTEIPKYQELSALEKAVATRKNASRIVFLAQAYREAASKASMESNIDGTLGDTLDKMREKSLQLYWEALKLNGNSAGVNTRCAAGLLKLPPPFQDLQKAEECIEKALKIAPNNAMSNHVAGMLYEKLSKFYLAEKFYKKSGELGVYGACMSLLRIKFWKDKKYDPMPELERMLQQFTENVRIQNIYLEMGSYQFYCKNDIFTALEYWMKAIEKDPNAEGLKRHKCSFKSMKTPVNLYELIADEIQLALEQKILTNENILKLHNMLLYCKERYPGLLSNEPQNRRQLSVKEQQRNKNQNKGRVEHWRNETQEEAKSRTTSTSSRDSFSAGRSRDYRNKAQSQLEQHRNWRTSPRDACRSNYFRNIAPSQLQQQENWRYRPGDASNSTEKI